MIPLNYNVSHVDYATARAQTVYVSSFEGIKGWDSVHAFYTAHTLLVEW